MLWAQRQLSKVYVSSAPQFHLERFHFECSGATASGLYSVPNSGHSTPSLHCFPPGIPARLDQTVAHHPWRTPPDGRFNRHKIKQNSPPFRRKRWAIVAHRRREDLKHPDFKSGSFLVTLQACVVSLAVCLLKPIPEPDLLKSFAAFHGNLEVPAFVRSTAIERQFQYEIKKAPTKYCGSF